MTDGETAFATTKVVLSLLTLFIGRPFVAGPIAFALQARPPRKLLAGRPFPPLSPPLPSSSIHGCLSLANSCSQKIDRALQENARKGGRKGEGGKKGSEKEEGSNLAAIQSQRWNLLHNIKDCNRSTYPMCMFNNFRVFEHLLPLTSVPLSLDPSPFYSLLLSLPSLAPLPLS